MFSRCFFGLERRSALFLVSSVAVLALAGCASRGGRVAPTTVGPQQVAAIVAAADAQWRRWGGAWVLQQPGGEGCALLADGSCLPVDDGCGREQSAALCPVVNEYWRALGRGGSGPQRHACPQPDRCEAAWPPEAGRPQRTAPWSAAFISAVMREAGFGAREFRFNAAHAAYVAAARDGLASAFEVLPTPAGVAPGDLICGVRTEEARQRQIGLHEIRGGWEGEGVTPMHCDIVVSVDPQALRAQAVGGNVQQSVSRRELLLGLDGRLYWQPEAEPGWVLVMKPRRALPTAAPPCSGADC